MRWTDEFAWSPVARRQDYSLTGALILEEATRYAGRPITLEANNDIWLDRDTIAALDVLAGTPGWTGVLTLVDARAFTVAFREEGVQAAPLRHCAPPAATDPYTLTLKLQTV